MAFDRIFADQTELDNAQGNHEFVVGEIYWVTDSMRIIVPIATAESKQFYGEGDAVSFSTISVFGDINVAGDINEHV